jgi:phosphoglycolate phosphatase
MPAPTVVFDLDGTLVDTAPDLVVTLNTLFAREGLRPVPYAQARRLIGGGARAMIERGLRAEGRPVVAAEVDRLFVQFIDYYSEHIAEASRPFPGVEAALDALQAQGFVFAICTNKLEALSLLLLDSLGLAKRFAAICGQDTFAIQKPDPEIFRRTVLRAGGDPARAIMIGDSGTDVRTARAAGVPVIAVDFGYTERPVAEFGPDRVISHFDQLAAAIGAVMTPAATRGADPESVVLTSV